MTRKSIADFIRQEAQNLPLEGSVPENNDLEQDAIVEELPVPTPNRNRAKSTPATKADPETTLAELQDTLEQANQKEVSLQHQIDDLQSLLEAKAELEATVAELQGALEQATKKESSLQHQIDDLQSALEDKAELEATVAELQRELKQATKKEGSLEQQIDDLRSALDEQKALTRERQKETDSAKLLKTELDEAKQAALALAERNTRLIEDLEEVSKKPGLTVRDSRKPERKLEKLNYDDKRPADFAAKSWLL